MKINGDLWEKNQVEFSTQELEIDSRPYGYVLEIAFFSKGDDTPIWLSNWNNRIYNSESSALNAAIQMGLFSPGQEIKEEKFRIFPLYRFHGGVIRHWNLNHLLNSKNESKKYELKSWKLSEDWTSKGGRIYKRGTIFIQLESGQIIKSGTTVDKTEFYWQRTFFLESVRDNKHIFEEFNIEDEKWLHPHLLRELKIKFEKNGNK